MKKSRRRDYIESLILVIMIALVIRQFVTYPCQIVDNEMAPTLQAGDYVWSYNLAFGMPNFLKPEKRWAARNPERNELVVFELPGEPGVILARRVLAIEGDKVEKKNSEPLVVPPGYFFAKIDNPALSSNAAQGEGLVPTKQLRGKIWLVWFSVKPKGSINWKRLFKTVN